MPKRVVKKSGKMSKTAKNITMNPTAKNRSEGFMPVFVDTLLRSGISDRSLSTLVKMDRMRGAS